VVLFDPGRRWIALAALTFARVTMGLQFQSVGAVSPLLVERLAIGNAELGILIGLFSLPGVVLALPGGLLGRVVGDRRLVLVGLLLMTLGSVLIGTAIAFEVAVTGRLLAAIGAVLLNVLGTKLVADWFAGREMVWAMSIFVNAWPVGNGLALLTLPRIANSWSVTAAFHAAAVAAALAAAALAFSYPRQRTGRVHRSLTAESPLSPREMGLVTLAAMPWMLYNVGYAVMLGFVPAFLVHHGVPVEQAGVLLGLTLVLFVGSVQLGGAAARWCTRPDAIVALGLLPFGVALILLPYASPLPSLIVIGLFAGLPASILIAAPATVLTDRSRAPGLGLFYTWYYAGMALMPSVAGWLQDRHGRAAAIDFAAAAVLTALVSFLGLRTMAPVPELSRRRTSCRRDP
jgi:predicted MFS family arabinose efflux permease